MFVVRGDAAAKRICPKVERDGLLSCHTIGDRSECNSAGVTLANARLLLSQADAAAESASRTSRFRWAQTPADVQSVDILDAKIGRLSMI